MVIQAMPLAVILVPLLHFPIKELHLLFRQLTGLIKRSEDFVDCPHLLPNFHLKAIAVKQRLAIVSIILHHLFLLITFLLVSTYYIITFITIKYRKYLFLSFHPLPPHN
jgi:hypothetical protein